jgi:hypothetical protein
MFGKHNIIQAQQLENQVADIFKKSVIEAKFSKLQSMLGVHEVFIKGG